MKSIETFTLVLIFFVSALYILTITHDREITKLNGQVTHERELHHTYRHLYYNTDEKLLQCKVAFQSLKTSINSLTFREELYAENVKLSMRISELFSECD
tara:strand:+ start:12249 stop:12548 length:300 start_codon:yes stop_codon:yes gene_type:complete